MYTHVCKCVVSVYTVGTYCAHSQKTSRLLLSHSLPLRQGFSMNLKLGWQPARPSKAPSPTHRTEVSGAQGHTHPSRWVLGI